MNTIEAHYTTGHLVRAITGGLTALGRTPQTVTVDDLGPVDEFHIGGRQATEELMRQLNPARGFHVLDVGSGLGGAARFVGSRYGCRVTGIDLTAEYVETAHALSDWVGLGQQLTFHHGSALASPFEDAAFDAAYMLHVGMNIADKPGLAARGRPRAQARRPVRRLRRHENRPGRADVPGAVGRRRRSSAPSERPMPTRPPFGPADSRSRPSAAAGSSRSNSSGA